jgi:hypothetical protein
LIEGAQRGERGDLDRIPDRRGAARGTEQLGSTRGSPIVPTVLVSVAYVVSPVSAADDPGTVG